MSLRPRSLIGLLGLLQQHGLTYAHLAAFVAAVQAQHSGPVTFQLTRGRIRAVTVRTAQTPQLQHD